MCVCVCLFLLWLYPHNFSVSFGTASSWHRRVAPRNFCKLRPQRSWSIARLPETPERAEEVPRTGLTGAHPKSYFLIFSRDFDKATALVAAGVPHALSNSGGLGSLSLSLCNWFGYVWISWLLLLCVQEILSREAAVCGLCWVDLRKIKYKLRFLTAKWRKSS